LAGEYRSRREAAELRREVADLTRKSALLVVEPETKLDKLLDSTFSFME
jgi:hypothetical protein